MVSLAGPLCSSASAAALSRSCSEYCPTLESALAAVRVYVPGDVMALASAGGSPETLYAGSIGAGILRSADGGKSWAPGTTGLGARGVYALAVYASETGTHLIRPPRGERWRGFERRFDERAYREQLAAGGHRFLPRSAPDFPPLLRAIHDPPAGLFLRGVAKPELLAQPAVAIVGARASSGYGASVARSLGRELAAAGLVVVSGLARGIDAEAHRGTLEAKGTTVAVLGCGQLPAQAPGN